MRAFESSSYVFPALRQAATRPLPIRIPTLMKTHAAMAAISRLLLSTRRAIVFTSMRGALSPWDDCLKCLGFVRLGPDRLRRPPPRPPPS
eukprot:6956372-Pyramimonas_sp.AAC.1